MCLKHVLGRGETSQRYRVLRLIPPTWMTGFYGSLDTLPLDDSDGSPHLALNKQMNHLDPAEVG